MYANLPAEQAAIGILLMDNDVLLKTDLQPEHFSDPTYRLLWDKAQQSFTRNIPFTPADVYDLDQDAFFKLSAEAVEASSLYDIKSYEESIIDNYWRRQATLVAGNLAKAAGERSMSVEDMRDIAAQFASVGSGDREATVTADAFVKDFRFMLTRFHDQQQSGNLATWPWRSWNKMLDPMEEGMLYVLGAASSTGKTTALECLAEHLARRGFRVAFVHLELSHQTMMQRAYARNTGVTIHAQRSGQLSEQEWDAVERYEHERDHMWPGEVIYIHAPGGTSSEIVRRVRMTGADVFIIDYAQKMMPTKEQAKLGDIVRYGPMQIEDLKILAESDGMIGVVASQLTAQYQTVEPDAAAIRWLKELEEKANGVIYIWREVATQNEKDKDTGMPLANAGYKSAVTRAKVTKQTMGETGYMDNIKLVGHMFKFIEFGERA